MDERGTAVFATMQWLLLPPLWLLWLAGLALIGASPNNAVVPISSSDLASGSNRSILEKDIAAVFNKVAYGSRSTTTPAVTADLLLTPPRSPSSSDKTPSSSALPPPVVAVTASSPALSVVAALRLTTTPITQSTSMPLDTAATESLLVSRARFQPPLPPEYTNPFADKPILRGSQSEHSASSFDRRKPPPPPPRLPRLPPEQERIPIRPPDLVVSQDRGKKPLNTPARGTLRPPPLIGTFAPETSLSHSVESRNDTDFDFVPKVLQNPSVTRILSGSSGRKVEEDMGTSQELDHVKNRLTAVPLASSASSSTSLPSTIMSDVEPFSVSATTPSGEDLELFERDKEEKDQEEKEEEEEQEEFEEEEEEEEGDEELAQTPTRKNNEAPSIQAPPPQPQAKEVAWDSRVWGVAWDVHVYLMGSLFVLLSLIALANFARAYNRLLPKGFFILLNGILLAIGMLRGFYLLFDAYNLKLSYPAVIAPLMLHVTFPLLTSAFAVLFLYLVQSSKVESLGARIQRPLVVASVSSTHLLFCLGLDLLAGCLDKPLSQFLLFISQALFLVWGVALAVTYLFVFGALSKAALRQQCEFLRAPFTKLSAANCPSANPQAFGLAVRSLLAIAMLMLLLAAVQLYGLFGVYGITGDEPPRPWPWWGFQFSIRVIEVSMCFLMVFVATLGNPDKETTTPSLFSLFLCNRSCSPSADNNKSTEDLYPTNCSSTDQPIHNCSVHSGKKVYDDSFPLRNIGDDVVPVAIRTSFKKSGTILPSRTEAHQNSSLAGMHAQRPSSMLFAEDGFVRFRTSADPEQPMDEVLHQSVSGPPHPLEAVTVLTESPAQVHYRHEELKYGMLSPHRLHLVRPAIWHAHQQLAPASSAGPGGGAGGGGGVTLHTHLPTALLRHPPHLESSDSDLASNSEEDRGGGSPLPSCSQDVTPDSAVGSDIYSKNGEGPVENRYWCEEEQMFVGLDVLSKNLIHRLKESNFLLHHQLQGYTPLCIEHLKGVPTNDAAYLLNACKLQTLYHLGSNEESAV